MFPVIRRLLNAVVLSVCLFSAFGSAKLYAHGDGGGHGGGGHGGGYHSTRYTGSGTDYRGGGWFGKIDVLLDKVELLIRKLGFRLALRRGKLGVGQELTVGMLGRRRLC